MPAFYCESMIEPFATDGWSIDFAAVSGDLRVQPVDAVEAPQETAILSLPYFGTPEAPEWLASLATWQNAGAVVISDETHRVLAPGLASADYRVASLRKMLPLPDGAYLSGAALAPSECEATSTAEVRLAAMKTKSDFMARRGPSEHRALFLRAEELTEAAVRPAPMSSASQDWIGRFDYGELARIRVSNARALVAAISASAYSPAQDGAEVRSHMVITGPDLIGLRAHLIAHRVFCPVHWPEPQHGPKPAGAWPTSYLSVPIDHRYSVDDLTHVGQLIRDHVPS